METKRRPTIAPAIAVRLLNTNYQRIVYVNFEGERPRLAAFANAMIRLTNERDPDSVGEIPMRNGFNIKPKNKEASKFLKPQNIKQEFQKYEMKVNSNNKSQEKQFHASQLQKNFLDVSLNKIEKQLNQQRIRPQKDFESKAALQIKKQDQLES